MSLMNRQQLISIKEVYRTDSNSSDFFHACTSFISGVHA